MGFIPPARPPSPPPRRLVAVPEPTPTVTIAVRSVPIAVRAPDPTQTKSSWFLDFSLIAQMDAIIFAIFKKRLEFDAGATSASCSYTQAFSKLRSPLSTVCSIFSGPCSSMLELVRRAQAERATGLFICRAAPDAGPRCFEGNTWYELLSSKSQLQFEFQGPQHRELSPTTGPLLSPLVPIRAFFLSFDPSNPLKRKSQKRKEKKFTLTACTLPLSDGLIDALPLQLARVSPLAPPRGSPPHGAAPGSAAPSTPLPNFSGFDKPSTVNAWNKQLFEKMAEFYPLKEVADIAREAVSNTGFDPGFTGDRTKRMTATNMVSDESALQTLRERLQDEVKAGRAAGPFTRCPFPNDWCGAQGWECPLGRVKKFKFKPDSDEFRLVSDFSFNKPHSVNDRCWNPRLLDCSLQASQLRALIARCGPRAQIFTVDMEKAFRSQFTWLQALHMFVYKVTESEFYADLRHPFGHITSEFCFHAITSVIQWATAYMGMATPESPVKNFVDNWFMAGREDDASFPTRARHLELALVDLGAKVHEQQRGTSFNGLGWDWNTTLMTFTCPEDKLLHYRNQAKKWAEDGAKTNKLSAKRVEKLTGTLNFLSMAAPCLRLPIAHLKLLKRKAESRKSRSVTLTFGALDAIKWLDRFLTAWTGSGKITAPFSPRDSWESLFRCDASSDFGFGAVVFPQSVGVFNKWTEDERIRARESDVPGEGDLATDSSTVIELLALKNSLQILGPRLRGMRVQFELDSQTAVCDLRSWSAGRPGILTIVSAIWELIISLEITPRFEHILRDFNSVADALSKNLSAQAKILFREEFGTELLVQEAVLTSCR